MVKKALKYFGILFLIIIILLISAFGLAYVYRNDIIELFVNQANKHISTKIMVDKIELEFWETFPNFSISFQNIRIKESYEKSNKNFAEAQKLYISLSIKDILEKKIKIKQIHINEGVLNFKINKKGENNFTIFKSNSDSATTNAIVFELSDIQLKNMRLIYNDQESENDYDILSKTAKAQFFYNNYDWEIELNTDIISNELKFNKLSFFKNKPMQISSTLTYTEKHEFYKINPTEIKVLDAIFNLQGSFSLEKKPFVDLKFSEKNSDIKTILSLIPAEFAKPLAAYKSNGNVYFRGLVNGYFGRGFKPLVKIDFGCKNASLTHPELGIAIKNMGFVGEYCNGMRNKNDSSYFKMKNIHADLSNKEISGNLTLMNLKNPNLKFDFKSKIDAKEWNLLIENSPFKNLNGNLDLDINFQGNLDEIKRKNYKSVRSDGYITLEKINFNFQNYKYDFSDINAKLYFNNTDIYISSWISKIGKSDIEFIGNLQNIIPFITQQNQNLNLEANLRSKNLFLDELLSDNQVNNQNNSSINLDSKIAVNLTATIENFKYNKINASQIYSKVIFKNKKISLENTSFSIANGNIVLNAIIEQNQDSTLQIASTFDAKNVAIDSIFYINDNFGQTFITNKQIKGDLTTFVNLNFVMSNKGVIQKKSLKSDIHLKIVNGHLTNFEVLKKMSKFVNEDALSDIKFSELTNDIKLSDEKIIIPEMILKSNITTMRVSGVHGFDNEFEYHIKLPLRNYRKKENLEDAQSIENDGNGGLNLYLKIAGNPDNFKVSYDTKAVKEHIIEKLKVIKDDFKQIFQKDYIKNKIEKAKVVELNKDEFLELD